MSLATLYALVTLLHVGADIVFAGGLLAASLLLAALSFQGPAELAGARGLVAGLRGWNRVVTTPALVVAWGAGLWLAHAAGWFGAGWLVAKLALVVLLSAQHGMSTAALRRLATAPASPSRAFRAAPVVAFVAIVAIAWLVFLKPF